MELVKQDDMVIRIAAAGMNNDAEELAGIEAHLETVEHHARKVTKNTERLRKVVRLRIYALAELGRVLNEIAPHGGSRSRGSNLDTTLASLGVSPSLSAKARKIAAIHSEDVRTFIEESGDEINISHLLRLHTESTTPPPVREWDEEGEWRVLISVLREYREHGTHEWRLALVSGVLDVVKGEAYG